MDVRLHEVQSVTEVLMGGLHYLCIYENFGQLGTFLYYRQCC